MKFKVHDANCVPFKKHESDAGYDLRSKDNVHIRPFSEVVYIDTGVSVAIPVGYVGLLCPRSSQCKTNLRTPNSIGIIDASYRGTIKFPVENTGNMDVIIKAGDRVCQLVVVPCLLDNIELVSELDDTERGTGGFGSTGKE